MAAKWIAFLVLFVPWLLIELWLGVLWYSDPGARETMGAWAAIDWTAVGIIVFGIFAVLNWLL